MDCFIGYTKFTDVRLLGATLEAWGKIKGIEPAAIQCEYIKYEFHRRVAAEGLSTSDYIIVDVGCVPKNSKELARAIRCLYEKNGSPVGMVSSLGVKICRKGVVDKWPAKTTPTYELEHRQAYEMKGYKVVEVAEPFHKKITYAIQ